MSSVSGQVEDVINYSILLSFSMVVIADKIFFLFALYLLNFQSFT